MAALIALVIIAGVTSWGRLSSIFDDAAARSSQPVHPRKRRTRRAAVWYTIGPARPSLCPIRDEMSTKVRKERGAVAVEMAILLPLLLLCIGGIVDLGRLLFVQTMVTNAAREGARMHSLDYDARLGPSGQQRQSGLRTATRYGGPSPSLQRHLPRGPCPD